MAHYLKTSKSLAERQQVNKQVSTTVEAILADIEQRGDSAVRNYRESLTILTGIIIA